MSFEHEPSTKETSQDEHQVDTVHTERRGAIFVVTLNRPNVRNAIDGPTATMLAQTFRAFDADNALVVAVLTGAGGTFCSGADLTAFADGVRTPRVSEGGDAQRGVSRM